jgi:tetratricopeptide (TPR) repeat protein
VGVGRSFADADGSRTPVNGFAPPRDPHPYPSPQGGGEFCRRGTLCLNARMPHERLRIFISAVTSEFGEARDALAADLRARDHEVTIQSDFQQNPDSETLLGALAKYIRDCNAVICIVGKRAGACPPPRAAEEFSKILPADLKEASYTQWEFFFARHFKRRPYVYIARDDYTPDQSLPSGDRTALQDAFRDHLKAENVHYGPFSNIDQLARAVLKDLPDVAVKPAVPLRPAGKPIVLPYPSIRDLFKGRDEFMQRLQDSLTQALGSQMAIVSLFGLGGVGKTRVAVEYARAHADEYSALLFAVAETPEALRRNLAALAGTLVPRFDTTDDEVRRAAVLDWLNANPGWFLILDNVDSKPALVEVEKLLGEISGGHVVVTSRLANFSANFRPLELDLLTVEDAAAFLLARTEGRRRAALDDAVKAREVAKELGGLAIMLEQAGAFIAKRRLTFAQYLEQWRSKRGDVLEWFDETVTGYPCAVAVTWQTSVAQLSEGGRRLLERLAWFAPEKVPESLLDVLIPGAKAENLREAFDDLAAYSLVTRDAEGPFFLVHRLVQDVTRRSLAGEARQCSLVEALGWINTAFYGNPQDVRDWPTLDPLAPHALTVNAYADAAGIAEPTARLMRQLGLLLVEKALHAQADPLMRRALAINEKSFGPDHPRVATDLNNLAHLLQNTNRLDEAEPLMRRALAIDEKSFGPGHPEVATDLNNLAQLLKNTNRLVEAEPLMRRALAIDEKSFGPDNPNVAIRLNNLALLLQATNRLNQAEPLMRRALAIDEKTFGPDHPEVATDLNNLGQLLKNTNRLVEAEPLMRRALAIDEKSFGSDHPNVAVCLNNLAQLLKGTKRLVEAEPLMRRALAIDENSFGPDHPKVAIRLNNLALLLQETNRLDEAEGLMRRDVAIFVEFTRRTRHRHPHLDTVFANFADLLTAMGKSQAEIDAACAELGRPLES